MKSTFIFVGFLLLATFLHCTIHAQENCVNPNQKSGYCLSIYDCPSLLTVVQKLTLTSNERLFLRNSQCENGFGRQPFVCCTPDLNFAGRTTTTSRTIEDTTTSTVRPQLPPFNGDGDGGGGGGGGGEGGNLLPRAPTCGPNSALDRVYNGNDTGLDEFIWMVLLEYMDPRGKKQLSCGGSLINDRYILTAAHCVRGEIEREVGQLTTVRLGEYDISKDVDCIKGDCNKPIQEVGIEEVIVHPQYSPTNKDRHHDIALLRLNRPIELNEYIRPVCLPVASARSAINNDERLIVSGWGRTLFARQSNVKQQLDLPIVDPNTCASKFATRKISIISSQICAGGEFSRDSCDGDSGGPLMRYTNAWYQEGVVSYGNRCGLEGWPGVYTRVSDYMDWIEGTVRS